MKIKICGKTFKSKKTLINHCKYILNSASIDKMLSGYELDIIDSVFKKHANYLSKTKGMSYKIGVRECSVNGNNRQFFIQRVNGSTTDFSYYKAISDIRNERDKGVELKRSLREYVKDQVISFKDNYFKDNQDSMGRVICESTGVKVRKSESHIDHYPVQFNDIVHDWFWLNKLNLDDIKLDNSRDNMTFYEIKDKSLIESFQEYHRCVASYRIVLDKVNLQRNRPKRRPF